MFSRLARRYDLVNDVMSLGLHRVWKRRTVRLALAGRAARPRLLDLCCGTGDLTFLAESAAPPPARLLGIDFTLPMLGVAGRRARAAGSRARFAQGDALRLPIASASVDVVTIGYGLRHIADPLAAPRHIPPLLPPP